MKKTTGEEIIGEMPMKDEKFTIKCEDCADTLEIFVRSEQVIFAINIKGWKLWNRICHSFGCIFRPNTYKDGGMLWISPKRWRKILKQLNNNLDTNKKK